MALAALAPLLGSVLAPAAADAVGLGISPLLASSIGSGLGTWAATGNPLTGLEGGALGYGAGNLLGGLTGGGAGAGSAQLAAQAKDAPLDLNALANSTVDGGLASATPASLVSTGGMNALATDPVLSTAAATAPVLATTAATAAPTGLAGILGAGGMNGILQNAIPGIAGAMLVPQTPASTATGSAAVVNDPGMRPYTQLQQVYSPGSYTPTAGTPSPYYFSNATNFASGGKVASAPSGGVDSRSLSFLNHEAMRSGMPYPKAGGGAGGGGGLIHAVSPQFGKGVPMPLGMADGGGVPAMLASMPPSGLPMGPPGLQVPDIAGDGKSDSVAATIDGQAPALLSSGEHVLSADVVSGLGNGSSAAGHKKLQAMAQRVRLARTGSRGIPPTINANAMLPG